MNATILEQTATHLTRQVRRWDRRLRLAQTALWLPRALIAGLALAVIVAAVAWVRPWLLPEQVAQAAGGLILGAALIALGVIWLRPQPVERQARYFDRRFALGERVSTALELTGGVIPLPERLAERQLLDASGVAQRVNAAAWLPLRVRWRELALLVALAAVLAVLLLSDNPQAEKLLAERELQNAIDQQIAALEQAIEDVENDPSLSDEEKDALTDPLEAARDILEQPTISQQEAVAAMAEAGQELQALADGMLPDNRQAYQDAASRLMGSDLTGDLAEALRRPDLGEAADAASELAENLSEEELSDEAREALAERLERAAEALEQSNPALAEKFREAAEALREGDLEAAEEALQEASEMMDEQQEQLDNSPLAQSAQDLSQQAQSGQQELAEAGQPSGDQSVSPQQGEQGEQFQDDGQQSQQPAPGDQQSQAGQPQPGGTPGAPQQSGAQQQQQPDQQGQLQSDQSDGGQASEQNPNAQPGSEQGEGGSAAEAQQSQQVSGAEGQSGQPQSQPGGQQSAQQGSSALSAGEGEGDAGQDTTSGSQVGDQEGSISTGNSPQDTDGLPQEYEAEYDPANIGGASGDVLDVGGENTDPGGVPIQEGEFGPNPSGQAGLSYTNVYNEYRDAIGEALDSGRIPLDQRDVIHDYFSSLEP
ncbi:MAG: hypothetical protein GXY36_00110 [Chloroflexi bacterium]|nr:hypothetical protein [Chloroflexota bacterium]